MLDRAVSKNKNTKRESSDTSWKGQKATKERVKKELGILTSQGDRIVYCLEYNKNKCEKDGSHEGKFGGKDCIKHHCCKSCLLTDKEKRSHPDGDETCPNKKYR